MVNYSLDKYAKMLYFCNTMAEGKEKKKHPGGRPPEPVTQRMAKRIANIRAMVLKSVEPDDDPILTDYQYLFELVCGGLTDEQLSRVFRVETRTIFNWKSDPEFISCLKNGKELADEGVKNSLYKRAMGYSYEAVKMFQYEGQIISQKYVEHCPPDVAACFGWLYNRQPGQWKRGVNGEMVDPNKPLNIRITFQRLGRGSSNGNGREIIHTGVSTAGQ